MDIRSACSEKDQRLDKIKKITVTALILNLSLSGLKFVLGILGRSEALVADAAHSLSDLTTDIAILLGAKFWSAPPDKNHPYGHRRLETIISLFIGFVLVVIGVGIGSEAIAHIGDSKLPQPDFVALIGALISIVSKEIMFRKMRRVGRDINSPAVMANSMHCRSDAISSIPVAIAICVAMIKPEWAYIDRVGAVVVSAFIIYSAWNIIKPAIDEITERGASDDIQKMIIEIANEIKDIKSVHALRTRQMGGGIFVDLHIEVDAELTVREGHEIAAIARRKLLKKVPVLLDVIIHIEPYD